jgi:iron complex outermembrane recepter protein
MRTMLSAAIAASLALATIDLHAQAIIGERQVTLAIESTSLAEALDEWAMRTGFQLLSPSWEIARRLSAPTLKGTYTARAALEQLLKDTPLTYEFVNERAVTVKERSDGTSSVPSGATRSVEKGAAVPYSLTPLAAAASQSERSAVAPANGSVPPASGDPRTRGRYDLEGNLEEILVTGSHIRGAPPDHAPVIVYDRERIAQSGVGTVPELLRKIPQNFAGVDSTTVGGGTGADASANANRGSSINLRGVGAGSTLVLLNGHRLSPAGMLGSFVDVSMIPLSAVERVEILTDGASAIYGADAVAGVVNFILRRDFEGAETSLRYGSATEGGGDEKNVSQLLGGAWDGGNVTFVYDYLDQDGLLSTERDFIPPSFTGRWLLVPTQERHSGLLTLRQDLPGEFEVFADALYSTREFVQDTDLSSDIRNHSEGETEQVGGTVGVGLDFASGWRAESVFSYVESTEEMQQAFLAPFIPGGRFESNLDTQTSLRSVELHADGALFTAPGGAVRASVGGGARREEFKSLTFGNGELTRDVSSAFAEVFVPVVGRDNARPGLARLEVSLAGRYEDYEDMGSSTSPKVGVLWSPLLGLNIRSTYARSFRVAPLIQQSNANELVQYFQLPDSSAPDGVTNTFIYTASGNPALGPEKSESYTVGFDLRPRSAPGLALSLTYFDLRYRDRIATPPFVGGLFSLYTQPALVPFIDRAPDPAAVQSFFDRGIVIDGGFPPGPPITVGDVEAIYDSRLQNIAVTRVSGIELLADYAWSTSVGSFGAFLSGDYLMELDNQAGSAAPSVDLVNKIYNPMDLRLRAGLTWSQRGLSISASVNHQDSYENNFVTPLGEIDSWTTTDLRVAYATDERPSALLSGLTVALSVQNVFDKDPPLVESSLEAELGFDPTNASPMGRFIAAQVIKKW